MGFSLLGERLLVLPGLGCEHLAERLQSLGVALREVRELRSQEGKSVRYQYGRKQRNVWDLNTRLMGQGARNMCRFLLLPPPPFRGSAPTPCPPPRP